MQLGPSTRSSLYQVLRESVRSVGEGGCLGSRDRRGGVVSYCTPFFPCCLEGELKAVSSTSIS